MPDSIKYLVKIDGSTAFLLVDGKASYLNCKNVGDFFETIANKGCQNLVIDLKNCTGMDSTFLGMIAGVALRLRKTNAIVKLLNPNERNKQLVENLGLHKLVKMSENSQSTTYTTDLASTNVTKQDMLSAHENLVSAESENLKKFEDVITFLKKEIQS